MLLAPQELTERLKAKQGSCSYRSFCCFIEIPLDLGKDESADLGEELSVVPEEHSQAFGQPERHESVRKTQQKIILRVLGEEQGSFLRTGRA